MKFFSLVRTTSAFVTGLILALSLQTALADDPTAQPPSGNISPNFYSNYLEEVLYIGYDDTITPFDTSYTFADATQLAVGYASPGDKAYSYLNETSGIFVQRDDPADSNGAVTGIINNAGNGSGGLKGEVIATQGTSIGYVGYVDNTGANYGLYTTDNAGVGNLITDDAGAVYTNTIYAGTASLDITASSGMNLYGGDLDVAGTVTAGSIGTFDYDYTYSAAGGSTSLSKTCDGTDEILIACSGRSTSTSANFLGAYQYGDTCYATRSNTTSGYLYVYAYCFDPTQ